MSTFHNNHQKQLSLVIIINIRTKRGKDHSQHSHIKHQECTKKKHINLCCVSSLCFCTKLSLSCDVSAHNCTHPSLSFSLELSSSVALAQLNTSDARREPHRPKYLKISAYQSGSNFLLRVASRQNNLILDSDSFEEGFQCFQCKYLAQQVRPQNEKWSNRQITLDTTGSIHKRTRRKSMTQKI